MATVPVQRTWAATYKVTAADLNTNVRDAVNFLLNPPAAEIFQSVAQSPLNATVTLITFDTAVINNDGAWGSGTSTTWTCQTAGTYRVTGAVSYAANATGVRGVQPQVNGSALFTAYFPPPPAGTATVVIPTWSQHFSVGDTLKIGAYQTSGSALALATGPQMTFLNVRWESNQ